MNTKANSSERIEYWNEIEHLIGIGRIFGKTIFIASDIRLKIRSYILYKLWKRLEFGWFLVDLM